MVLVVSPKEWLALGLELVGFEPRRQNCSYELKMERFLAHFGASPDAHCAIFSDLQTTQIEAARIEKPSISHFLMAILHRPA